ncbi:MAG: hypothetical protein PHX60_07025 [Giesbergeria sp.]|uniref:hypothetical protein n=1 Tax=Giesbergeria sp. TaxID=2818473 RepID=UPI0026231B55|nr:hypothetical protein [Giesbergeria sp.]MDD2609438.1 hypothetical protein [Giesbergeria sp.]
MSEIEYLVRVILSKGYCIKTKNSPTTRNLNDVMKIAVSAGSESWWLAITDSESSKNVLGVFYIDNDLNGWGRIDWDESKIISLHDLMIEAANLEASESEASVV